MELGGWQKGHTIMTVCARKLLVILNAMVRSDTPWSLSLDLKQNYSSVPTVITEHTTLVAAAQLQASPPALQDVG